MSTQTQRQNTGRIAEDQHDHDIIDSPEIRNQSQSQSGRQQDRNSQGKGAQGRSEEADAEALPNDPGRSYIAEEAVVVEGTNLDAEEEDKATNEENQENTAAEVTEKETRDLKRND